MLLLFKHIVLCFNLTIPVWVRTTILHGTGTKYHFLSEKMTSLNKAQQLNVFVARSSKAMIGTCMCNIKC